VDKLLNPDREAVAATFYQTNNSSNEIQRTDGSEQREAEDPGRAEAQK
jgi:hypothetical protein